MHHALARQIRGERLATALTAIVRCDVDRRSLGRRLLLRGLDAIEEELELCWIELLGPGTEERLEAELQLLAERVALRLGLDTTRARSASRSTTIASRSTIVVRSNAFSVAASSGSVFTSIAVTVRGH